MPTGVDVTFDAVEATAFRIIINAYFSDDASTVVGTYTVDVAEVINCQDRYFDSDGSNTQIEIDAGMSQTLSFKTILN